MASLVGSRVERKEDKRFLTGKGRYTSDINIANQTYAIFIRSPHARAKIKKVDTSKALKPNWPITQPYISGLPSESMFGLPFSSIGLKLLIWLYKLLYTSLRYFSAATLPGMIPNIKVLNNLC